MVVYKSMSVAFVFCVLFCSNAPTHSSKEVVVVMGALTSSDPGNVLETIQVDQ